LDKREKSTLYNGPSCVSGPFKPNPKKPATATTPVVSTLLNVMMGRPAGERNKKKKNLRVEREDEVIFPSTTVFFSFPS
jgi:hypothetical protein